MEGKKFIFIFSYAVVFLFSGLLFAQDASRPGYYVDKSTGEPVFKQRLVWDKEEYVLYYEVSIQIFSERYREYHRETTENTFIEISLAPGKYRYNVTPYDLLGRRCDSSEWEEFTINTAFQPEIIKIAPEFFYMDQNQDRVLLISGNNIFDDSAIYLRNSRNNLIPVSKVITNNSSVRLTFDDDELVPGTYELYIQNPGGLEAFKGGFFVGYHRRVETFVKVDFNPAVPISGEMKDMLIYSYLYYPGVTFRLESLSSERASFKAGMEFALSFYYLDNLYSVNLTGSNSRDGVFPDTSVSLTDFSVNISMQSRFNHLRNAITFYFGFGLTTFNSSGNTITYYDDDGYGGYDYSGRYDIEDYNRDGGMGGHVNLGITGLFLVYKVFYIETGVDLTYYFSGTSTLIKPRVGLVLKI